MAASNAFLQVNDLTKSFGDLLLFSDLQFGVAEGQRVALIAQNGKGKSTLLDILAGRTEADSGSVVYRKDLKVGYLEQNPYFDPQATVMDAFRLQGHDELKARQILTRLKVPMFDTPFGRLSGGERKRVALAAVLIAEPQLLILDEPTNHLDLEMTEWLENYLVRSGVTLLMVTHDRYFLDRVCNIILEIDNRQLYTYHGNYSYFLEKRQQRTEQFNAELQRANNLFRYELDWMRRMPCARGTKARARKDAFYDLKEKVSQRMYEEQVTLDVKATYIGSKIFEAKYISKSYGEQKILDNFYYNFARYEKVGVIGRNGAGKSTFLKMLLGLEPCDAGSFDVGQTVVFGYYSQEGLVFDEGKKVIDVVRDIAEEVRLSDGRHFTASQFLSHFLFHPSAQQNYVSKLSGGEKRRLYLCTVLMRNPNFLVLDEPTNDLDIVTLNVLEEYLRSFKGCVLVVSHDRYFMDKIVDHLLVFKGNAEVQDFPGNYTQYREWRDGREAEERRQKAEAAEAARRTASSSTAPGVSATSGKGAGSGATDPPVRKKRSYKEQKEYEALEVEIAALEARRGELEAALSSGKLSGDEITADWKELSALKETLDLKEMRWLELDEL